MSTQQIPADFEEVYSRPRALTRIDTHYCPGCTHGTIHRLVAEVIDELGCRERTIGVAPVGCSVMAYYYFDVDFCEAAHGRAPAMACGVKRVSPDKVVFTYQGDGDLASIGTNEIIHCANRGEKFTTIFVNNAVYGMTGGQMAPTTLVGQVTASSPFGRSEQNDGRPIKMAELLAGLGGTAYVTRQQVFDAKGIRKAKAAIKLAFQTQMAGLGFSMVEILSVCPVNWHMDPSASRTWGTEKLVPYFPVGDTKVIDSVAELSKKKR